MKNTFFILVFVTLSGFFAGPLFAQKIETISSASVSQLKENNLPQQLPRNQVPARAHRHFMQTYSATTNASWLPAATGPVAMFYVDGMQQLVFYDKKGNWTSTVLNYNESKLPKSAFNVVKSAYCDYAVTHCSEVETNAGSVYYLTILKNNDYKQLKIQNDEIGLVNQYVYSKGDADSSLTKQ